MAVFRTATINTLYQLFGKGVSLILGLYITALISQTLSVADYGRYVLVVGLVLQIAAISEWGTGFIAVRAASQNLYTKPEIFTNLLISRLVLSSIGTLLLFILAYFQAFNIPSSSLIIASLIIVPLGIKNVVNSFFQALTNFRIASSLEVVSNIIYALLLYLYATKRFTLNFPISALAIATFVTSTIGLYLVFKRKGLSKNYQPKIIKYLFLNSIPVGGQLLIFNIYNRFDLYLLQIFQSETAVARYGLAYKMYENAILVAAYFMNSLFPVISNTSHVTLKDLYNRSTKVLIALGLSLSLLLFLLAPVIIKFINPEYSDSVIPLRILSLGLVFTYINHATGYTLTAINKQHVFMGIAAIGLGANIVLNIILIPHYSYNAAATTTIFTEAIICTISFLVLRSYFHSDNSNK